MTKPEQTTSVFQEKYRSMPKAEVIEQYNQDKQAFLETLREIPTRMVNDKFLNGWGIKEITAHIAAWDLETIRSIETVLRGEIPWSFDDEKRIGTYNLEAIEEREDTSLEDNLREIETNHQKLIEFLKEFPDGLFHQGNGQIWKNQEVTPSLVCSYRHYLHHTKDILEWLGVFPR